MDRKDRVVGLVVDVGAYEIECEDISNVMDWNADGLVNLYEFNYFSKAWLSHDPNDPAWLADPNLADPNLSEGWYEWKCKCNLNATGDSAYSIDIADLIAFSEDNPQVWGWKACWISEDYLATMLSGSGAVLSMNNSSEPSESSSVGAFSQPAAEQQPEPVQIEEAAATELSIGQQIAELQDSIDFLESLWNLDPNIQQEIDADQWQYFMETVNNSLLELKMVFIQIE